MKDFRYYYKRIVSWVAFHANKGRTWEQIVACNAKRKDPFLPQWLEACKQAGFQAAQNAGNIADEIDRRRALMREAASKGLPPPVFPPMRLCDLPGCRFPDKV